MRLIETIKVALNSLRANILRSFLTILGIIVGIFSIIAISTLIAMLQGSIEEGISALNQNTFQIQKWPAVRTGGPEEWAKYRNRKDITIDEYFEFKDMMDESAYIGAEQWNGGKVLKFRNEETNPNVSLCGATPETFVNNDWIIEEGRDINYNDYHSSRKVVVLGADVAKKLFSTIDPIGQELWVDGKKVKVIGILESQGQFFGQSRDNFAIIPISTYQSFYGKRGRSINITVRAASESQNMNNLIDKSIGYMRTIRKVEPTEEPDFEIRTNEGSLKQINEITSSVRIGAIVIAAIALLAAGIGIMNIMLVSVTERTREIGIRKAIGAKSSNILFQFLFEAITLCIIGGIFGIFGGLVVGNIAGSALEAKAAVPLDWVIGGVFICIMIGLVFGTYPAYKASNLDPIEALRYE